MVKLLSHGTANLRVGMSDVSYKNARGKIYPAVTIGVKDLITLCPVCDRVLRRPTSQLGLTKIYITDLCRIALGEKQWPA